MHIRQVLGFALLPLLALAQLYPKTQPDKHFQRSEKVKAACNELASRLIALCRGVSEAVDSGSYVSVVSLDADGVAT